MKIALSFAPETMPGCDKRRQILSGANRIFMAQGYEGASMSSIAQEVGVSKGTLYVYFTNKEALFRATMQHYAQEHVGVLFEYLSAEAPLDMALRNCGTHYVGMLVTSDVQAIYRVAIAEAAKFPELGRAFFEVGPGRSIARLAEFLSARAARGELVLEDADLAAQQFFGLCRCSIMMQCQLQIAANPAPDRIAKVVDSAVSMFLKAYAA